MNGQVVKCYTNAELRSDKISRKIFKQQQRTNISFLLCSLRSGFNVGIFFAQQMLCVQKNIFIWNNNPATSSNH